jgi:hypothetical protein
MRWEIVLEFYMWIPLWRRGLNANYKTMHIEWNVIVGGYLRERLNPHDIPNLKSSLFAIVSHEVLSTLCLIARKFLQCLSRRRRHRREKRKHWDNFGNTPWHSMERRRKVGQGKLLAKRNFFMPPLGHQHFPRPLIFAA